MWKAHGICRRQEMKYHVERRKRVTEYAEVWDRDQRPLQNKNGKEHNQRVAKIKDVMRMVFWETLNTHLKNWHEAVHLFSHAWHSACHTRMMEERYQKMRPHTTNKTWSKRRMDTAMECFELVENTLSQIESFITFAMETIHVYDDYAELELAVGTHSDFNTLHLVPIKPSECFQAESVDPWTIQANEYATTERFQSKPYFAAVFIGLTPNEYKKRVQAAGYTATSLLLAHLRCAGR